MAMVFGAIPLNASHKDYKDTASSVQSDHDGVALEASEMEAQTSPKVVSDAWISHARYLTLMISGFSLILGVFETSMVRFLSHDKTTTQRSWVIAASIWSMLGQLAIFGATLFARREYFNLSVSASSVITGIISYVMMIGTHYHWVAAPLARAKGTEVEATTLLGYILLLSPLVGSLVAIAIAMPYGKITKANLSLERTSGVRIKLVIACFVVMVLFGVGATVVAGRTLAPLISLMAGAVVIHAAIVVTFVVHFLTTKDDVKPNYLLINIANFFTLVVFVAWGLYLVIKPQKL